MYHLLKGLHEYLTRKDEYSILILGMAGAGKTTLLEQIKTLYNDKPGLSPDKITPTVGQNTGKITLPSTILQFWDLGGQTGIRNIWHRYYDQCHAIAYVVDAHDREQLEECWEVFDNVLSTPQILHVPLLLLANKQDCPGSLSVHEVRENYEAWWQRKREQPHHLGEGEPEISLDKRVASLAVIGISALKGEKIKDVVEWLFLRVQGSSRLQGQQSETYT